MRAKCDPVTGPLGGPPKRAKRCPDATGQRPPSVRPQKRHPDTGRTPPDRCGPCGGRPIGQLRGLVGVVGRTDTPRTRHPLSGPPHPLRGWGAGQAREAAPDGHPRHAPDGPTAGPQKSGGCLCAIRIPPSAHSALPSRLEEGAHPTHAATQTAHPPRTQAVRRPLDTVRMERQRARTQRRAARRGVAPRIARPRTVNVANTSSSTTSELRTRPNVPAPQRRGATPRTAAAALVQTACSSRASGRPERSAAHLRLAHVLSRLGRDCACRSRTRAQHVASRQPGVRSVRRREVRCRWRRAAATTHRSGDSSRVGHALPVSRASGVRAVLRPRGGRGWVESLQPDPCTPRRFVRFSKAPACPRFGRLI